MFDILYQVVQFGLFMYSDTLDCYANVFG